MSAGSNTPGRGSIGDHQLCLECGARNFPGATKCFLCGQQLKPIRQGIRPPPLAPTRGPTTFSLTTLLLFVTYAGVCFGLIRAAPGLGILFIALTVPGIRLFATGSGMRAPGQQTTFWGQITEFTLTLGIGLLALAAGSIAFFAALFAICASLTASAGGPNANGTLAGPIAICVAVAVVFGAICVFLNNWLRRR